MEWGWSPLQSWSKQHKASLAPHLDGGRILFGARFWCLKLQKGSVMSLQSLIVNRNASRRIVQQMHAHRFTDLPFLLDMI